MDEVIHGSTGGSALGGGNSAPWPDFNGQEIHAGDVIEHPNGDRGIVVFLATEVNLSDQWLVDYGQESLSRLCLQVGDKGRAVVVLNAR